MMCQVSVSVVDSCFTRNGLANINISLLCTFVLLDEVFCHKVML